jgi:hypothetical protein
MFKRAKIQGPGVFLAAGLLFVAGFFWLTGPADGDSSRVATSSAVWRSCARVTVEFQPEGGGGAIAIKARGIRCRFARKVVRRCINGKLTRGWSGVYFNNRFILRRRAMRIRYLPVGGGGCLPVYTRGRATSTATVPVPPAGADRVTYHARDLDRDRLKERVLVYNLPTGDPIKVATTWFDVWNRRAGAWRLAQRMRILVSPGASNSGLRKAWVGDLNRDGKVELVTRNAISPSFGQLLPVLRQAGPNSLRFKRLQVLGGDAVGVWRSPGRPAILTVYRRENHSSDNMEHSERWKWSARRGRWTCRVDCMPRTG